MKICRKCVLPDNFPGIRFNSEGICNFCSGFQGIARMESKKSEYRKKFRKLLKEHKGRHAYDALMCYSGGKDSTYTLSVLKKDYGLNILAVTFDNGFLPEQTFRNIQGVVENLGVDHIIFKPRFDVLKKIFGACSKENIYPLKTLERASVICTSCIGLVKFNALRMALEKNIPFIGFGWSPGQAPVESSIFKNNPVMLKQMQEVIYRPLYKIAGRLINPYFPDEEHFNGKYSFPYNIHPLAFLEYDEAKIYREISRLGWKAPLNTDSNSSNCLLNSYANQIHSRKYGFNPYVFEIADMVRKGIMTRQEGLRKFAKKQNDKTINFVKNKLLSR